MWPGMSTYQKELKGSSSEKAHQGTHDALAPSDTLRLPNAENSQEQILKRNGPDVKGNPQVGGQ